MTIEGFRSALSVGVVQDFKNTGLTIKFPPQIVYNEVATFGFDVTVTNEDTAKDIKEATAGQINFYCMLRFAETNIGVGASASDPFNSEKTASFNETTECTVSVRKDMATGLYSTRSKSFIGTCNITLGETQCAKANYVCMECPAPRSIADGNPNDQIQCVKIPKEKVFCTLGRSCLYNDIGMVDKDKKDDDKDAIGKGAPVDLDEYIGKMNHEPISRRCKNPNDSCVVLGHGTKYYQGCTGNKTLCTGLKEIVSKLGAKDGNDGKDDGNDKMCCQTCATADNCNTKCTPAAGGADSVKISIMACLSTMIVILRLPKL